MHRRGALLSAFLLLVVAFVSAQAAYGGLGFATAAPPSSIGPLTVPARGSNSAPSPQPAAATRSPSPQPKLTPSPVALPGVAIPSEVVAVASRTDQKLTLIDPTTAKVSKSFDIGIPPRDMTLDPSGHLAWVFSAQQLPQIVNNRQLPAGA